MTAWCTVALGGLLLLAVSVPRQGVLNEQPNESYLTWSASQCEAIGKRAYQRGRVGGLFDMRLLKTERSYNYKLAATLLTPDVKRATARLHQLRNRLSSDDARALVAEAEAVQGTVVLVEIDPREGSGVIPLDWQAFLQPKGSASDAVSGVNTPQLRTVRALSGVQRRNYDYDRFWMVFPLETDASVLPPDVHTLELVVRIHDQEGRVEWPASGSLTRVNAAGSSGR